MGHARYCLLLVLLWVRIELVNMESIIEEFERLNASLKFLSLRDDHTE